jgi:signal transduction histidine kinase/CheY-like chemotaxis protein/HPt (histidine-containing phosphotransfer) domain-containing protein
VKDKREYLERFFELNPEYQPDGLSSREKKDYYIKKAFNGEKCVLEWVHKLSDGSILPMEITLVRLRFGDDYVVAAYKRDLREYKQIMEDIDYRDYLLNTVNNIASTLIQTDIEKFESDLDKCLKMLARAESIDRVMVSKNYDVGDQHYYTDLYEWSGATGLKKKEKFKREEYVKLRNALASGECIHNLASASSPEVRQKLLSMGLLAFYLVPVFLNDSFWGFIGYCNCEQERVLTENEQTILRSVSYVVANALQQNSMMQKIHSDAARLEAVVSNYPGVICSLDKNYELTLFDGLGASSLKADELFVETQGLEESPAKGVHDDILDRLRKTFAKDPQDWTFELKGKTYHAYLSYILDNFGNSTGVVGSFNDITEMSNLQAELESALEVAKKASSAKSNFLASMSHEMRTPLNAIIGLSELTLGTGDLSDEAHTNLEKIFGAGSMLLSTVNDILDISKIEAGRLEIVCNEYDIPSLINDTVTQNLMRIGEKPIKFVLDIEKDLPSRLGGDELRVKQILNNLLSNAMKYSKQGIVKLSIHCQREGEAVWVTMIVQDSGVGIKPEDIGKLFLDYAQLDTKAHHKIEGTGLGLPITKRLVEMMGGSIHVESEYGKGSLFTVKICQKFISDETIGQELVESLKSFHYTNTKRSSRHRFARVKMPYARVLIVDDISTNLDVAKGLMKPYEMQIDCLTSGIRAIEAIRDEKVKYDAVFMDHMMPDIDGIEATRIIRQEIGTDYAKNVPIVALTANAVVGNEKMFLENGFQDFLSKPIDLMRLDTVLRRWVYSAERENSPPSPQATGQAIEEQLPGEASPDRLLTAGKNIDGLDMDKGIERFGSEETFLEILQSFADSTRPLLNSIKNVSPGDLSGYAIQVHGIKGSGRGICAYEVGDKAEALERAAKSGQYDFVASNNDDFVMLTESLISRIYGLLNEIASGISKPKKDRPSREMLAKLSEACSKYDMDMVEAAMSEIDAYEYETDDALVAWLKENVSLTNFEQISDKILNLGK